jgi:hypothetical protein
MPSLYWQLALVCSDRHASGRIWSLVAQALMLRRNLVRLPT